MRQPWNTRGPLREKEGEPEGGGADPMAELKGMLGELSKSVKTLAERTDERFGEFENNLAYLAQNGGGREAEHSDGGGQGGGQKDHYDFINDLNERGFSAIEERLDRLMEQRGLLTAEQFDRLADSKVNRAVVAQALSRSYPDIGNKDSEFYKTFLGNYNQLEGLDESKRMQLAAEQAELSLRRAGKYKEPESEEDRMRRIMSQNGPFGVSNYGDDKSDELSDSQKGWAKAAAQTTGRKLDDAMESYKNRAKQGVNYSSATLRRAQAGGGGQ